jgi:hypothetical protein
LVSRVYEQAGAEVANPPGAAHLATLLLGDSCLGYAPPEQSEPWRLLPEGSRWRVLVRATLTRADKAYAIALALARWTTIAESSTPSARELEDLASRLLLPAAAVHRARLAGLSIEEVASTYVCPLMVATARMRDSAPKKSGTFRSLRAVG